MTRRYTLKKRAARQADTRQRIIDAAIELHGSPGIAGVTSIAALAGVSRLTVYRYFPDEKTLFAACTGVYFDRNPPPDVRSWLAIDDPLVRLETGLRELYAYYSQNEGMATQSEIGAAIKPALREVLAPFAAGIAAMRDVLLTGLAPDTGPRTLAAAAVGHAVAFSTWRALRREQDVSDDQAVEMMVAMIRSVASVKVSRQN